MTLIDALAQEIRRVDGSHTLGAAALAEAIAPFIAREAAAALSVREDGVQLREIAHDMGKFLNKWRHQLPADAMAESYALHNRLNNAAFPATPPSEG